MRKRTLCIPIGVPAALRDKGNGLCGITRSLGGLDPATKQNDILQSKGAELLPNERTKVNNTIASIIKNTTTALSLLSLGVLD